MRIFGKTIFEKFKGFFAVGATPQKRTKFWASERTWQARCKHYDQMYITHPLAKQGLLTIAGKVMAQGLFVEAVDDYARAEEAAEKCRQLNDELGLDVMVYDTVVNMGKLGSCFWEKSFDPVFDVRIIPAQELVEPATQDDVGNITSWRQASYTKPQPSWSSDEIVHHAWNVTTKSWPYGTSMLVGLETEFETLEKLEEAIANYAIKQGLPKELWQVGDKDHHPTEAEIDNIVKTIKNWEAGEEFVTGYHIDRKAGGTGDHPLTELAKILEFCYTHIVDGLMIAPISKQWSSTMASAQEMEVAQRANIIVPIQRVISRNVEQEVYKPYLESLGFSVRVCPKLQWEAPDAHKDEEAEYYAMLVQSGIIPAELAAEEMGFDMDKVKQYREAQLRREAEQMQYGKIEPQQNIKQKVSPQDEE